MTRTADPVLLSRHSNPSAAGGTSRRLKVLQVGKYYPPHMGGIETHLQALCTQLQKWVDLRVVVANEGCSEAHEVVDGVPVSRLSTRMTVKSAPVCSGMAASIRESGADIVHLHLPNPAAVVAYLASGHRGRLVVTYHSDTVRQKVLRALFGPCLHAALRRSSAIIATSPDYRRSSSVLARHLERCYVVPYGISLEQFEACDSAAVQAIRQQHGERLVLSVGRLVYYKGFEYLIRAMQQVRGKLLLIGDGPLRQKLSDLAASAGVSAKVAFLGEIQNEEIVPYYHACDVFALASVARSEAFGIVQIEAMAAGTPVVNTRLDSGVPFVSVHNETGLTVAPGDPEALAAAINRLLDDGNLRASLGAAGRLRARREFSVETMGARIREVYERVTAAAPGPGRPLQEFSLHQTHS